jgi:hypothetical protein
MSKEERSTPVYGLIFPVVGSHSAESGEYFRRASILRMRLTRLSRALLLP